MKLDPALLTFLVGTVIPFLTAFVLHRNAKAGIWPATKAVLAAAGAVLIAVQQHNGILSKETVVVAAGAFITAHVTDWGVLHQSGAWSWLLDTLGSFGIGKPALATGGYLQSFPPVNVSGPSWTPPVTAEDRSRAAHPSNITTYPAPNVDSVIALAQRLSKPEAMKLLNIVGGALDVAAVHGSDAGLAVVNNDGTTDLTDHASGAQLFGAPIPADLPIEAIAVPQNEAPPQLWAEDAAGAAANVEPVPTDAATNPNA